jgi:hypothetical protein
MFEVKDGARTLQFNGTQLGASTSWRRGSTRWIEFELYRTEGGSYILSRIGVSLVYHGAACSLVKRYSLTEISANEISNDSIPCPECEPTLEADLLFPEKHRYWAQVYDDPTNVLDALYKYDDNGVEYLTNVAQRLLDAAAKVDPEIAEVYHYEIIP